MVISPFQALTILAKKYSNYGFGEKLQQIKQLYLVGIRNSEDETLFQELMKNEALTGYKVSFDKEVMNNDPVRRYFESYLSHEILKRSLDDLSKNRLETHYDKVFNKMSRLFQLVIAIWTYRSKKHMIKTSRVNSSGEFSYAIALLNDENSFLSLKPDEKSTDKTVDEVLADRKEKMIFLAKLVFTTLTLISTNPNSAFPLDIYGKESSPFSSENRGRTFKSDEAGIRQVKQEVYSNAFGIMKNFMPLPRGDVLYSELSSKHVRGPESTTYVEGAQVPEAAFSTRVTPFVNSISGTILVQLKVIAQLFRDGDFEFQDDPTQLKLFLKCYICFLQYYSGGHSLNEFISVLELPEVRVEFQTLPGFEDLNLKSLFQDDNEAVFERAIQQTITYNDRILARNEAFQAIAKRMEHERPSDDGVLIGNDDVLTRQARSRLRSVKNRDSSSQDSPLVLERYNGKIDRAYDVLVDESVSGALKSKAEKTLKKAFNIGDKKKYFGGTQKEYEELKIKYYLNNRRSRKKERHFKVGGELSLAERIDRAWEIYKNDGAHTMDREVAQEFLIYALDVYEPEVDLNNKLIAKMEIRGRYKHENPNFIPGVSPFGDVDQEFPIAKRSQLEQTITYNESKDDNVQEALFNTYLIDVNPFSKRKDNGEITGEKTIFFTDEERDSFRMDIHNGLFKQAGKLIDTSSSTSHGKGGFASFTLCANGELYLFKHFGNSKNSIFHSSLNSGKPVVCAGELKIENGKLLAITTHSGHYRPPIYSLYRTLRYFKGRGVDINQSKLYSFVDLSKKLEIVTERSIEHPKFYVANAGDLCHAFKAKLRKDTIHIKRDLKAYSKSKTKVWRQFWYFLIGYSEENTRKVELSDELQLFINQQAKKLNKINHSNQISDWINSTKAKIEEKTSGPNPEHNRLYEKLGLFSRTLDMRKVELSGAKNIQAHNLDQLKMIGRKTQM